jgi:hypothetical protein
MEFPAGQTQQRAVRNCKGRFQALLGDQFSGAMGAIDLEHLMVHAGRYFGVSDLDTSVDIASPKEWLFVTPDDDEREFHIKFLVVPSAAAIVELFEGATTSADGTPLSVVNHRRTSDYESELSAYADPTITDDGDRIGIGGAGSVGGPINVGAQLGNAVEFDLKPNTAYLLRATVGANGETVSMASGHYEFDVNELTFEDGSSSSA